ncbi:hypothetical protein [Terasakiella pusilla]|uniref:hypothetical protein n=1 Tax=Terasakiella pusilla TaxID=64973 RepID=UPI0004903D0F|nr:hypothetical protein [Terasakiella pusilla]
MFNRTVKKESISNLEKTVEIYDANVSEVQHAAVLLHSLRENDGAKVIKNVEGYINQLANSPKEFEKSFSFYKAEFAIFNNLIKEFSALAVDTNFKAGGSAIAGTAAGVGTAALMPSAAMAVATTFGTASTGTAISTLGGAAATNAALAWLGGGALSAGGAGMAGGTAFLALAGPIGIGIGAVSILGSGLYFSSKNKKIAQEANEKTKEIELANKTLEASKLELSKLIQLTKQHSIGVLNLLSDLQQEAPSNYDQFTLADKQKIGALINHINSLSELINKKVA